MLSHGAPTPPQAWWGWHVRPFSSRMSLTGREATTPPPAQVPAEWKFFCFSVKVLLLVHSAGMGVMEGTERQSRQEGQGKHQT